MSSKIFNKQIIALAPMDGYTDYAYRQLIANKSKTRPDFIFTEFVNVEAIKRKIKASERILLYSEEQRPVVAQLFGKNPESFYQAAKQVLELGFDGIDINMGCPAKNIAGRNEGAGLINFPELAVQIVSACKSAIEEYMIGINSNQKNKKITRPTLSVKTRLGYKTDIAEQWIGLLLEQGLDFITLHGRTFSQGYSGTANWDRVLRVAKIYPNKVIGNGDIKTVDDAKQLMNDNPYLLGIMIGRNSTCFFDDTPDIKLKLVEKYLEIHKDNLSKYFFRKGKGYDSTKKMTAFILKGFEGAAEIRLKLFACNDYDEALELISELKDKR